jgi:chemotaxis-related protein WspB
MLLVVFQAGAERFGLEVTCVREVLALPALRPLPSAPEYVAGVFDYHGTLVPAIDLSQLLAGRPARLLLSTRVILVDYAETHLLGLVAEHATETVACRDEDWLPAGVAVEGAPYLGPILRHEDGMIQRVTVEELLAPAVRETLFAGL